MNIAYYMPFKPLGHPNPSGDLVAGTELYNYLNKAGHTCHLASQLRCRWIYLRPRALLELLADRRRVIQSLRTAPADLWLSYHSYYKAPDLLGPYCAKRLGIPYVLFQGIYSTKRRRKLKTRPGFYLNRQTLLAAQLVFTNKKRDRHNLLRLLPPERVCYIAPGLHTRDFTFSAEARAQLRSRLGIDSKTVIMSAAMFRPGVKTEGISTVIKACAQARKQQKTLQLLVAGDGSCREQLEGLGKELLGTNVTFLGKIPRNELHKYYSAADIFAFPGVEESLGMVYLEAQSCGLPVVAYEDWGGGEAVSHGKTGLLSPASEPARFIDHLVRLVEDQNLRSRLGRNAATHVRRHHELERNYQLICERLTAVARDFRNK